MYKIVFCVLAVSLYWTCTTPEPQVIEQIPEAFHGRWVEENDRAALVIRKDHFLFQVPPDSQQPTLVEAEEITSYPSRKCRKSTCKLVIASAEQYLAGFELQEYESDQETYMTLIYTIDYGEYRGKSEVQQSTYHRVDQPD